ncbi:MAG: hypothetical protein LBC27_05065 [Spirochaetaceae bacterium]|jgi:hypothetical protein|nr:hypothetical protein [Spirochaetaceae bacterium]
MAAADSHKPVEIELPGNFGFRVTLIKKQQNAQEFCKACLINNRLIEQVQYAKNAKQRWGGGG